MKISIRQLKSLISEAFAPSPDKRADGLVSATVDAAEKFVDSLVARNTSKTGAEEFKQLVDQTASITKWLAMKRDPRAQQLVKFVRLAQAMADEAGFWKRPAFLGRDDYLQQMQSKLRQLQSSQFDVLSN